MRKHQKTCDMMKTPKCILFITVSCRPLRCFFKLVNIHNCKIGKTSTGSTLKPLDLPPQPTTTGIKQRREGHLLVKTRFVFQELLLLRLSPRINGFRPNRMVDLLKAEETHVDIIQIPPILLKQKKAHNSTNVTQKKGKS